MSNSIVSQIPKNLMFRYRISCEKYEGKGKAKFDLDDTYQLPHLGNFDGQASFAEVRVGWNEEGLFVSVDIAAKKQSLWCRATELLDSDGLQVWIDTRDTHNVHRATKFCHWFVLMPAGGGEDGKSPLVTMLKINRSREDSPTINRVPVLANSKITKTGYRLTAFISGKTLIGWDTNDQRNIGFNYSIVDRELGRQTLAIGPELPIQEDPSLWQTLTLV